ncbi:unnamed protein product, partial [Coregonus sp. 'balchen']
MQDVTNWRDSGRTATDQDGGMQMSDMQEETLVKMENLDTSRTEEIVQPVSESSEKTVVEEPGSSSSTETTYLLDQQGNRHSAPDTALNIEPENQTFQHPASPYNSERQDHQGAECVTWETDHQPMAYRLSQWRENQETDNRTVNAPHNAGPDSKRLSEHPERRGAPGNSGVCMSALGSMDWLPDVVLVDSVPIKVEADMSSEWTGQEATSGEVCSEGRQLVDNRGRGGMESGQTKCPTDTQNTEQGTTVGSRSKLPDFNGLSTRNSFSSPRVTLHQVPQRGKQAPFPNFNRGSTSSSKAIEKQPQQLTEGGNFTQDVANWRDSGCTATDQDGGMQMADMQDAPLIKMENLDTSRTEEIVQPVSEKIIVAEPGASSSSETTDLLDQQGNRHRAPDTTLNIEPENQTFQHPASPYNRARQDHQVYSLSQWTEKQETDNQTVNAPHNAGPDSKRLSEHPEKIGLPGNSGVCMSALGSLDWLPDVMLVDSVPIKVEADMSSEWSITGQEVTSEEVCSERRQLVDNRGRGGMESGQTKCPTDTQKTEQGTTVGSRSKLPDFKGLSSPNNFSSPRVTLHQVPQRGKQAPFPNFNRGSTSSSKAIEKQPQQLTSCAVENRFAYSERGNCMQVVTNWTDQDGVMQIVQPVSEKIVVAEPGSSSSTETTDLLDQQGNRHRAPDTTLNIEPENQTFQHPASQYNRARQDHQVAECVTLETDHQPIAYSLSQWTENQETDNRTVNAPHNAGPDSKRLSEHPERSGAPGNSGVCMSALGSLDWLPDVMLVDSVPIKVEADMSSEWSITGQEVTSGEVYSEGRQLVDNRGRGGIESGQTKCPTDTQNTEQGTTVGSRYKLPDFNGLSNPNSFSSPRVPGEQGLLVVERSLFGSSRTWTQRRGGGRLRVPGRQRTPGP